MPYLKIKDIKGLDRLLLETIIVQGFSDHMADTDKFLRRTFNISDREALCDMFLGFIIKAKIMLAYEKPDRVKSETLSEFDDWRVMVEMMVDRVKDEHATQEGFSNYKKTISRRKETKPQ